jgi:ABC-type protease/lipase transport system fused ATPase/permease subunit
LADKERSDVLRDTLISLRSILFFAVGISLVYGLLRLAGPLFMILVFDRVVPAQSEATLASLVLILVIILTIMALLDYSRRRVLARFGAQFQERIEEHIFRSRARDTYFARNGSKPAAGLNEADRLRSFFHSGSLVAILDFMWSPVFLGIVFVISPFVGWVVVAGLALLVLINLSKLYFAKAREERHSEASDRIGDLKNTLFVSRHVIESQGMTAAFNKRWVSARRESRDTAVEHKDFTGWFSALSSHLVLLLQYLALAAAAYLTIEGELTVGSMVAAMILARRVAYATERFLKQLPSIHEARENWRSLEKALSAPQAPTAVPDGAAILRLSNVTVRCPLTKNKLLRNISVDIEPGLSVQIVGGAAAGKTVLAETLLGRFRPSVGKILLGAIELERLPITDTAKTIGYVPQHVSFVPGSIEENIGGLEDKLDRTSLVNAARVAQVHEKILSLPEGYLTRIDALGSQFSKSERHMLALARALYSRPTALIVDEPDTSLREALSKNLKDEIGGFLAGGGILIILTRIALRSYRPSQSFVLCDGNLKAMDSSPKGDGKVVAIQGG